VIDDGARTTSRSKTRRPAPLTVCIFVIIHVSPSFARVFRFQRPRVRNIIVRAIITIDISAQKGQYENQKFRMFL
jgi:hypothetical protein